MPQTPEELARVEIDKQLTAAGWIVQDANQLNLLSGRGIAVREAKLKAGHGTADYLLFGDKKVLGIVEAKKEGETLTGVEVQTEKYSTGLPTALTTWHNPLPFLYQSTGVETRFTNALEPDPRSRHLFTFHRPETLLKWAQGRGGISQAVTSAPDILQEKPETSYSAPSTPQRRLRSMPILVTEGMRDVQIRAITNIEKSLAEDRPRSLVQMTMGSGKTYTAVAQTYRMLKFGGIQRVLFLVDRGNLARQTLNEFQQYTAPDDGRKFTELYNVQHLKSNKIDPVCRVCITTIQRLYSMLKGEPEFDPEAEEVSAGELLPAAPLPVVYNPAIPIETFDLIVVDECHRSIYNLWRQALEYFDAYLIGLTATPSKQTFGYFNQNLVMEYNHAQSVADGVNVDFDVYRIKTQITEQGSIVEAGLWVDKRDRRSRRVRWEALEQELTYAPNALDRAVVAEDQIRLILRTYRDRLFTEIFPGRSQVPKTLIFAKDDSHADDIVRIVREEFGKGNDFCEKITSKSNIARIVDPITQKVTFKSSNVKAEDLLSSFRNSVNPRIAVTVDMIATGTDIKPLEVVFFLRDVKSANYFEQMKGRGSRTIATEDFQQVTPDAKVKTRFVLVDAVGTTERERVDAPSLDRQPTVAFGKILDHVGMGSTAPDVLSTLASRLSRLNRSLTDNERQEIAMAAGGIVLKELIGALIDATDADKLDAQAQEIYGTEAPTEAQILAISEQACAQAATPFLNPVLRNLLLAMHQESEQTIDRVSQDTLLFAGANQDAKEKALALTVSFADYIKSNKEEITALQFLYSRPYGRPPTLKQIKELAAQLGRPPHHWTPDALWRAYETLEKSRVRGSGQRVLTDLISLVRFALEQETILAPFAETVQDRFAGWLTAQEAGGRAFTPEQRLWLTMIRDHVATSLMVDTDDFDSVPFNQQGGLGRAHALFGNDLNPLLEELNEVLTV